MSGKPGRNVKHGHTSRVDGNHKGTREYRVWLGMRRRCYDEKSTPYPYYGARGIAVCDRWRDDFAAFFADMGTCPEGMTLDRIDNAKGYEPDNCRWATRTQQNQNSSCAKLTFAIADEMRALKANGVRTKDIAARYGVNKATVERVLNGQRWTVDAALASEAKEGR